MKLRLKYFIAVNVGLSLAGACLIFIGIINGGVLLRPILEAIGIGLLAAGAINILDRALNLEQPSEKPTRIEVTAEKRLATPQEVFDKKYATTKVDIIGVSLTHLFEELLNDPGQNIIHRLLYDNLQLRIFFSHPESMFLIQRANEDRMSLAELKKRQKHIIELVVLFYKQLRAAYDAAKQGGTLDTHKTGSLQIKLLDYCPYITLYRLGEEEIYWGLYLSHTQGVNLPLFRTMNAVDPTLYRHLHQHIHGLMDRDTKYPDLVSMPELGKPELNFEMVTQLGLEQVLDA